jgi:hypothetical protein
MQKRHVTSMLVTLPKLPLHLEDGPDANHALVPGSPHQLYEGSHLAHNLGDTLCPEEKRWRGCGQIRPLGAE